MFGLAACQDNKKINEEVNQEKVDSMKKDSFKKNVLNTADDFIQDSSKGGDTTK